MLLLILSSASFAIDQQKIASTNVTPPVIEGKSWLLIDNDSGAVLSAGNPDMQIEPASLTKLMTAYIVFRELTEGRQSLDDMAGNIKEYKKGFSWEGLVQLILNT